MTRRTSSDTVFCRIPTTYHATDYRSDSWDCNLDQAIDKDDLLREYRSLLYDIPAIESKHPFYARNYIELIILHKIHSYLHRTGCNSDKAAT